MTYTIQFVAKHKDGSLWEGSLLSKSKKYKNWIEKAKKEHSNLNFDELDKISFTATPLK